MIILGIDPGSRKAGYAFIQLEGKKLKYLTSGTMKYDSVSEFIDRLGYIYDSCRELLDKYHPNEIAIESLIYVKSVTSLAKLAQARGAMVAAFMSTHESRVSEYSPNLIKSSVTGHGHATKESVDKALQMIYGKINFKTNDESDALAIATCHALNRNNKVVATKKSLTRTKARTLKEAFKHKV